MATASSGRTRCTSVVFATAGNLCTTISTEDGAESADADAARLASSGLAWPFHLPWLRRFFVMIRVLLRTACFSRCSIASPIAAVISPACANPTSEPNRELTVISALCRRFSTARMTLASNLLRRILRSLARPSSISLRLAGVTS